MNARAVLLASGSCFVVLACLVVLFGLLPGDVTVRDTLLALGSPAVVGAMRIVNRAGAWQLLLPATILLLLGSRRARERWWVWVGLMVVAPLAEAALKLVFARPRPEDLSFGFPSGHATAAAAFFGAVMYLAGCLPGPTVLIVRAVALVLIVLVGLARVLLRAHWPSDVLGGVALGLALASAAALVASPRDRAPA